MPRHVSESYFVNSRLFHYLLLVADKPDIVSNAVTNIRLSAESKIDNKEYKPWVSFVVDFIQFH